MINNDVGTTNNNDDDSLTQKNHNTTKEIHWIESESLFAVPVAKEEVSEGNGALATPTKIDDEDLNLDNLFVDPDPYETFALQWKIMYIINNFDDDYEVTAPALTFVHGGDDATTSTLTTCMIEDTDAQITVVGNKAENGQTLHSTGLTLWRASQILTDFLVAIHNQNTTSIFEQHQQQSNLTVLSPAAVASQCPHPITGIFPYCYNNDHHICNGNDGTATNHSTIAVLELGCGLGIPSMLYHYYLSSSSSLLPSRTITFATDADIQTLHNLRWNLARVQNEQEALSLRNSSGRRHGRQNYPNSNKNIFMCQQLIWGNMDHIQSILQTLQSHHEKIYRSDCNNNGANGRCHDANSTSTTTCDANDDCRSYSDNSHIKKFDIILGSDIIYVEHVVEPLFRTVRELLNHQNNPATTNSGVFLLAFARRNVSIDYVLKIAQQLGFVYEYIELATIAQSSSLIDQNTTARITTCSSCSAEGVYIFRLQQQQDHTAVATFEN